MSGPVGEWRDVPGYEGYYQVTADGCVRSLDRKVLHRGAYAKVAGRVLRPTVMHAGHLRVALSRASKPKWFFVHRLVLMAFVGPCPEGLIGLHRDGEPSNNCVENLYWGTYSDNSLDAVRHGTHNMATKTRCVNGHEFTPENTWISSTNGQRVCRTCAGIARRAGWRRHKQNYVRGPKATHCQSGRHLWSEQDPYIKPNGRRECRLCRDETTRRRRAAA